MKGDADPFFTEISVSDFFLQEPKSFVCLNKMISLLLSQLVHQKPLHILFEHWPKQI